MARTVTIAVAQYEIPPFKYPQIHWSLVAFVPGSRQATRYHIIGNTDSYGFDVGAVRDLLRSTKLMGGVKVAEISEEFVANGWLEDKLRRVPIVRNDPKWNCQSWVVDAIRTLADRPEKVTVQRGVSMAWLREALGRQWDLCESLEDHFFDGAMH